MPNKNRPYDDVHDFVLSDYANAGAPRARTKKRSGMPRPVEERNWDDDEDEDEDEDETDERIEEIERAEETPGVEYPPDVWFQISKYIRPEDVGRFAGICRATLSITRSAHFWFGLHRRHRADKPNPPPGLGPDRMALRCGLRARVIRALHFSYDPFAAPPTRSGFSTPKDLLKRRCVSMWYEKPDDRWIFFFKLKPVDRSAYGSARSPTSKKNIFDILDDIMVNPENDCKILKVRCDSFPDAPPVMGMILNEIYTKVASNMRHNNLNLGFSQSMQHNGKTQECTIVLNNVIKMEVFDWWHPSYPYSGEFLPNSVISSSSKLINYFDF